MKLPLFVLRWLHRRHLSRKKLRGSWLHRWLGDHVLDKSLWRATPESLARAWLIGIPITAIPFLPFQSVIAGIIGFSFRANLLLCIALQYLSNPFTAIVQFPICYVVGKMVMGESPRAVWTEASNRDWSRYLSHPQNLAGDLLPLYLGSVVSGLVVALMGYWAIHAWGNWWHRRHPVKDSGGTGI